MSNKKILITSAHPDDFELGMAMRTRHYFEQGFDITAVVATKGEYQTTPKGRHVQEKKAAKVLGVKNLVNLKLPCSRLNEFDNDLRSEIERFVKELSPNMAYTIFPDNLHIDHLTLSEQSIIAYRSIPNVSFYRVVSTHNFFPNDFFFADKRLFGFKIKALKCFREEVKKTGTIDLEKIKTLSLHEHKNYIHHNCLTRLNAKQKEYELHSEMFQIVRKTSL